MFLKTHYMYKMVSRTVSKHVNKSESNPLANIQNLHICINYYTCAYLICMAIVNIALPARGAGRKVMIFFL